MGSATYVAAGVSRVGVCNAQSPTKRGLMAMD